MDPKRKMVRGSGAPPESMLRLVRTNVTAEQDVDVTVFAPPEVPPREDLIVQVIFHSPEQEALARKTALKVDKSAEQLASVPLKGDQLRVTLECKDADIPEAVQSANWNGRLVCVHFLVQLPDAATRRTIRPKARVSVNGVPAASVFFRIDIVPLGTRSPHRPANESVHRFRKPFLSYAAEDRVAVLKVAQVLSALKMDYFQDIVNLSPGDRWEQKLYSQIQDCDLFMLFWSRHARQSDWVIMEAEFALKCRQESSGPYPCPEIVPVLLEGPPVPPPPDTLSEIHFNDPLRHIIFAEEAAGRERAQQQIRDQTKTLSRRKLRRKLLLGLYASLTVFCGAILIQHFRTTDDIEIGDAIGVIVFTLIFLGGVIATVEFFSRPSKKHG